MARRVAAPVLCPLLVGWLLVGWLLVGCAAGPSTLADSVGVTATWTCAGDDCRVTGASVPPPDCEGVEVFTVYTGAIAMLCVASVLTDHTLLIYARTCRPLRCADPGDCPATLGRAYGCEGGLCSSDTTALDSIDIVATCLRDVPRGDTCAEILADPRVTAAIDQSHAACSGGRCTLPMECLP